MRFGVTDKTLWLVLIDVSGSMAQPFSGTGPVDLNEVEKYRSKLEAAKDSLLRQMRELGRDASVAIISFSETADLVYLGPTDNTEVIRLKTELLKPTNKGTNIADALTLHVNFRQIVSTPHQQYWS